MSLLRSLVTVFVLLLIASTSAFAATAVSASMNLTAHAELGGSFGTVPDSDAWGILLSSLGITAGVGITDVNNNSVSVGGSGNATWLSAGAGSITFEEYGWNIDSPAVFALASLNSGGPDWEYTFMADPGDATFRMAYDVSATGDKFGLWGWAISVIGGPEGVQSWIPSNAFDPTISDVFVASLTPGNQYRVELQNNANIFGEDGLVTEGYMNGSFRWEIRPNQVPEPHTLALLMAGMTALGFARRRRD